MLRNLKRHYIGFSRLVLCPAHFHRRTAVKNKFGWSEVAFCACQIMQLFPVVFCVIRAVLKFHLRLVINKTPNKLLPVKGKVHLVTCHVGTEGEYRYSSALSLTFWHRTFTFNSNKSPAWYNNFSVYYPDVCLQLNMFRAFSRPSSGAQWQQWQPLVLPSYRGDSRAVTMIQR